MGSPDPEQLTWSRPSPRMWSARLAVVATVAGIVLAAFGIGLGAGADASGTAIGVLAVVAAAGATVLLLHRRYRAWGYAERGKDLLVRRGVMFRHLTVVPYGRMQFVDVTAGPVERMFGLATVRLHTAAAATDAQIPGLARSEADRLRDRLAALGEAQAAGL